MSHFNPDVRETFEVVGNQIVYDRTRFLAFVLQRGQSIYGNQFVLTPALEAVYLKVLSYAIHDHAWLLQHGFDPQKGLLIMGPNGSGKTAVMHLMKVFFQRKMKYTLESCRKLAIAFSCKGYDALSPIFADSCRPLCLDSLGRESTAKYFGTNTEVVLDIVEHFYDKRLTQNFPHLHITTSLSASEIESRYGILFRRRLKELFNVIVL